MRRWQRPLTTAFAPVTDPDQAGVAHQPGDTLATAAQVQVELGVDLRGAIGAPRHLVDRNDRRGQLGVGDRPGRGWPGRPVLVPGPGDVEHPAGHRDADTVVGELTDQPEPRLGRTFSRAK